MFIVIPYSKYETLSFFNQNGEVISDSELKGSAPHICKDTQGVCRIVDLGTGTFWLLRSSDHHHVSVRYYAITDQYPLSSRETLETGISSDFSTDDRDPIEFREKLQALIQEERQNPNLRYPPKLIDAICGIIAAHNPRKSNSCLSLNS
ncbi:MAG: hypothetical protein HYT93_04090 [Parcubacteria group bacterium]|nr:hypothetical protein [Parcubacteria group bacterium]